MKAIKTLLVRKSIIAAAVAASAVATGAFAASTPIIVDIPGTPNDGMICPTGYNAALTNNVFKCSKTQVVTVVLECTNPSFPTYVIRAPNGPSSDGKDLCVKAGVIITSTGSLGGLVDGKDYVKAQVNPATITERTNNKDHQEAVALGLTDGEVDTAAGPTVTFVDRGVGSKDNADLPLTHFVFGKPNLGLVSTAR